ncbi:MAG: ABC transporter ATP-binding protein, partial [Devosia sp.]
MTAESIEDTNDKPRRLKAVVGSHREEEEAFGKAYDPRIVRRIMAFVKPYRKQMLVSVAAVVIFTGIQLTLPLIIRYAIDHGMAPGADGTVLNWMVALFAVAIIINFAASHIQELVVGKAA